AAGVRTCQHAFFVLSHLSCMKTIQVALLRGINVGGHKKVSMSELRDLFGELGFASVKTLLQSGNVVFEGLRLTGAALEQLLEKETSGRLGVSVDYVVRSADEWKKIVARNPFPGEAQKDPSHLVVMCMKAKVDAKSVKALELAIQGL